MGETAIAPGPVEAANVSTSNKENEPPKFDASKSTGDATSLSSRASTATPSKTSSDTVFSASKAHDSSHFAVDSTAEFSGDVNTDNQIPSRAMLKNVQDLTVMDKDGRIVPFKSLYTGPNVARRVLIIFIRHFLCGNCQEYVRSLAASMPPSALLSLPTPTFIAIIGCGSPSLIPMYASATSCPFPIYADPTKRLYNELGMLRTLKLGTKRPEYQRKGLVKMAVMSVFQGVKLVRDGRALKAGDMQQVGGEFLFEPVDASSPIQSPELVQEERGRKGYLEAGHKEEAKRITWCHRMKNTRDHAEIPELREVLGMDADNVSEKKKRRWTRALGERKGTGLSGRMSMSSHRSTSNYDVYGGRRSEQLPRS